MMYLRAGLTALSAAGLLTKLLTAAGVLVALLAAYGVWHHQVYSKGYVKALVDVAKGDARAVGKATQFRSVMKDCKAQGRGWDQTTGRCS